MELLGRERSLTISWAVWIKYTNVTDGQTRWHSKDRASRHCAGKKPESVGSDILVLDCFS